MLSRQERLLVYAQAYLPEHLPHYVEAISGSEPFLHENHLCFFRNGLLTFIGYPLGTVVVETEQAYASACKRFRPLTTAIIAPEIWLEGPDVELRGRDDYYRMDLPSRPPDPEVAYMVRRAARELRVLPGTFGREHKRMVKAFVSEHSLTRDQEEIFGRLPHYLKRSPSARLLEARKGKTLVAFTVVETASARYAFYLFNFRSIEGYVPGASDLLFMEMIELSRSEGKSAINLGLSIHPGIRRFKEKWGGVPFLPYASALVRRERIGTGRLADKL